MALHGCDVSTFQATMDFSSYDFVIIKSSEGIKMREWKDTYKALYLPTRLSGFTITQGQI